MSSFTSRLEYRKLKKQWFKPQNYQLLADFEYYVKGTISLSRLLWVKIPSLFITDFASTPFWIHWKYPPIDWYAKAVLVHDWLYHTRRVGKETADWIMIDAMNVLMEDILSTALEIAGPALEQRLRKEMEQTIKDFKWAMTTVLARWAWNKHRKRERVV